MINYLIAINCLLMCGTFHTCRNQLFSFPVLSFTMVSGQAKISLYMYNQIQDIFTQQVQKLLQKCSKKEKSMA